jgi:hypothetical protein
MEKTPNGTKRRMEKTPNGTKGRIVSNIEWQKRRMEKTQHGTKRRMEKTPTGRGHGHGQISPVKYSRIYDTVSNSLYYIL